ncbi:hypothetical protein Droror1_Dr00018128 [Drosera rotundifolia]
MAAKLKTEEELAPLKELFQHQTDSYDYLIEAGLNEVTANIKPIRVFDPIAGRSIAHILSCRQMHTSCTARLMIDVNIEYKMKEPMIVIEKMPFGDFPVMVKSKSCNLRHASVHELISRNEDSTKMGGYFILKGIERVVRSIIIQKRNYPMSMVRSAFRGLREGFSDKAVSIRCVRDDQSAVIVKLYYLNNGSARVGFWTRGREYLLPVGIVLKALKKSTAHEIYVALTCVYAAGSEGVRGVVGTQLVGERAKIILDE